MPQVDISVPIIGKGEADLSQMYAAQSISLDLTIEQAEALLSVTTALDRQQARLARGQRVTTAHGALRWIIDQIVAGYRRPTQSGKSR